jgi:hypothetical protein
MQSVVAIDDRGDLVVGRNLEEGGLELLVLAKVDGMDAVREPDFLQHDRHFQAVRRGPGVKLDHGALFLRCGNDACP